MNDLVVDLVRIKFLRSQNSIFDRSAFACAMADYSRSVDSQHKGAAVFVIVVFFIYSFSFSIVDLFA